MIDTAPIQTLVGMLTPISLTVGVIYYIINLRNSYKTQRNALETRQAQLFMQVYERWNSSEFIKFWFTFTSADFDKYEFGEKMELDIATRAIGRFMEGIGVLLKRFD